MIIIKIINAPSFLQQKLQWLKLVRYVVLLEQQAARSDKIIHLFFL